MREFTFQSQKQLGVIPADTLLTQQLDSIPAWDCLSPVLEKLYARMMEVYAVALAHIDARLGFKH